MAPWNPLQKDRDVFDPRQYGPTVDERKAEVQRLADRSGKMTPAEREQVAQDLSRRLQSERSPAMKLELIRALGRIDSPAAETALRVSLADPDSVVRRTAVEAWAERRNPQAVQTLARTLTSDTDLDVRLTAATALGAYQDRAAVEALGVALDDPDPALQFRAIQSLQNVTGRDYGVDVAAWRQYVQGREPITSPQPSIVQRWFNWF